MMGTIFENNNYKFKWISIPSNFVWVLIFANLAITLPLAIRLGVWVDEAYSLQTTSESIGYALERALKVELQAPLYFILLNLWRNINGSIFFARLFSIICIALSIFLSVRVSARYLREINPLYFSGLIAFNPFTIWAALEIRRYAFVILLSALLFIFFYDAYIKEEEDRKAKFFYTVTAIVGLYTQYYIGMLLVAQACAILATGNLRRFHSFVLQMLIAGLVFSPMLLVVFDQMSRQPTMGVPSIDVHQNLKVVQTIAENFIIPMNELPLNRFGRWVVRLLAVFSILMALKNRTEQKPIRKFLNQPERIAISFVVVLLLQFFIILLFIREELLRPRHVSFSFLPAMILFFSVLNLAGGKKFFKSWVLILICLYGIALFQSYKATAKLGDFKRVASYIMSNEKPGEPILIFPQGQALPLKFHYSGLNIIVPIPGKKDWPDNLGENYALLNNESEIVKSLSAISENPEVLWVVRYPENEYLGIKYNIKIFDKFIENNYRIKASKSFFMDTRVMLIEKK